MATEIQTTNTPLELWLMEFRKEMLSKLNEYPSGIEDLEKNLTNTIDSFMGSRLHQDLINQFGDYGFKVRMKNFFRYSLPGQPDQQGNPAAAAGSYKYVIDNISWKWGPDPRQVFFYILENYRYLLETSDYNRSMFSRRLPGIEQKYMDFFVPHDINRKQYNAIPVFITRTDIKERDPVTGVDRTKESYFVAVVKDTKLSIGQLRGATLEELCTKLQERLEDISYSPQYSTASKRLAEVYEKPNHIHQVGLDGEGGGQYNEKEEEEEEEEVVTAA